MDLGNFQVSYVFNILINLACLNRTIYETPAIYGLIRATPKRILDGLLGTPLQMLKKGTIDQLFPMMVEKEDIPVIFNFDVEVILVKSQLF